MITFSAQKNSVPAVTILPTLEVIISVRKGDDPEPVWALWKRMTDFSTPFTPYVFDTCHVPLQLEKANEHHHDNIKSALYQTCQGNDPRNPIAWINRTFLDVDHQDCLPQYGCGLTLGWITAPDKPRGISFRVTVPDNKINELADLGIELARTWPDLWRWISIGYRFIPVQWYSTLMPEALEIISGRCKRFLGVDVGDIFGLYTSIWQNCLRTVNWMTFVCDDLIHHLEDTDFTRSNINFDRLNNGIVFKTGALPNFCDRNRNEPKAPFVDIDHRLSEIRANKALSFSPMWDTPHTIKWLNRFQDDRPFDLE